MTQPLREAAGEVHTADDFAHRSEHFIEFQLIFLGYQLYHDAATQSVASFAAGIFTTQA